MHALLVGTGPAAHERRYRFQTLNFLRYGAAANRWHCCTQIRSSQFVWPQKNLRAHLEEQQHQRQQAHKALADKQED